MKKTLASLFALAMVLSCALPAMAFEDEGMLANTVPEIVSIHVVDPVFDSASTEGCTGTAYVEVVAYDVNGEDDLEKVLIQLDYTDGALLYKVFEAMPSTSVADAVENDCKKEYMFEISVPSTWNQGDYKITATPFDYSTETGNAKSSDMTGSDPDLAYMTVQQFKGLTCEKIVFMNIEAGGESASSEQVTIKNTGNADLTLAFTFDNMYLAGNSASPDYILGGNMAWLGGNVLGYIGTEVFNGNIKEYAGTGNYQIGGTAEITGTPTGLAVGTYTGTFTIAY